MWCWAASGEMVMHYLGTDVKQCTQANDQFGRTDCPCAQCGPSPVANPPCVQGGWPDFAHYHFSFTRTSDAPLTQAQVRSELSTSPNCGSRPVAFTWHWSGGGGHVMVLTGYQLIGDTLWVTVQDPWAPCGGNVRALSYAAYVSGSGYTHWDDFYGIKRLP